MVSLEQLLHASQIPERALMAWPYLHHLPASYQTERLEGLRLSLAQLLLMDCTNLEKMGRKASLLLMYQLFHLLYLAQVLGHALQGH